MRKVVIKSEKFYSADLELVKSKINQSKQLCEQIDCLIAEAASGGKHDTGCFADEFSDIQNENFDVVQKKTSDLLNSIRNLSSKFN